MSKKHHHDDSGMELHFDQVSHHGVRYENRDLGGRSIIAFLIALVVTGFLISLAVYGYFGYRAKQVDSTPLLNATASAQPATMVSNPNQLERFQQTHNLPIVLQNDDVNDMNKFRSQNDAILNSYGWTDQKAGIVHIPIDQAMRAIAQQGLPTRPPQQLPPAAEFGTGANTVAGAGGGTRPETRQ